ncbi:MAG: HD-GYP domain-containing protein [Deltaproteobacteria bacterium]|nr:HD-GYP domain-containing protein [Deltaproteobacteria bacterium]
MDWFGRAVEKLKELLDEIPQTVTVYEKMVHPEDHDRLVAATQRHLDKQEPFLEEYRIIGKGGKIIYLRSSGICLRNEKGRPYKWVGALSDITERKKKEEELKQSIEKLHKAMGGIIQAMALTVETRDPYTAGHQRRVADLARSIGQEMGLSKDQIEAIRMAGTVHDLGKISLPAEILSKPTKLSQLEFSLIKVHPQTSYEILKDIEFPWPVARIVSQHHERINGSGYPLGLKDREILLEAKVLMVADVVEAIASHRPYRAAYGIEVALDEISKNKGILYDPEVVEACLKLFKEKRFILE